MRAARKRRDPREREYLDIGRGKDGRRLRVPVTAFDYHTHLLSATQSGKTFFLKNVFMQLALRKDRLRPGLAESAMVFIDPKGNAYPWLLRWAHQKDLADRLILIDPAEPNLVPGFDPFHVILPEGLETELDRQNALIPFANDLADNFIRLMEASEYQTNGPVVREMTMMLIFSLMVAGLSMASALSFLNQGNSDLRNAVIDKIQHPYILGKWQRLGVAGAGRGARAFEIVDQHLGSVARRIETYCTHPAIRRMLGSPNPIRWDEVLDQRKIVLVNLGEMPGLSLPERQLLGTQIVAQLVQESLSRVQGGRKAPVPCYTFIDECHYFVSPHLDRALSTVGQFKLRLFLAHQYLNQLYDSKRDGYPGGLIDSVRENCHTKVVFKLNSEETADRMARDLCSPWFNLKRPKQERLKQLMKVVPIQIRSRGHSVAEHESESTHSGFASGYSHSTGVSTPSPHPDQSMPAGPTSHDMMVSSDSTASGSGESKGTSETFSESVTDTYMTIPDELIKEFDYYSIEELVHMAKAEFMTLPQRHGVMKYYGGEDPVGFETKTVETPKLASRTAERENLKIRTTNPLYLPGPQIDRHILTSEDVILHRLEPPALRAAEPTPYFEISPPDDDPLS